jgi:hypothetical protein
VVVATAIILLVKVAGGICGLPWTWSTFEVMAAAVTGTLVIELREEWAPLDVAHFQKLMTPCGFSAFCLTLSPSLAFRAIPPSNRFGKRTY